ncbi:MAG: hypothetical protein Q8T09_16015 [Candidatus Melainabacteria bacterium]|nr:hypothetical protein [Candidatus Melainabacteria bacterium]
MSAEKHTDPSQVWMIMFMVAFCCTVLSIGVWAMFNYKVDAVEAPAAAGHH